MLHETFSRVISTFRRESLKPLDRIDVSNQLTANIRPRGESSTISYTRAKGKGAPRFPPNTVGFLYFHIPPKAPPLAGEIRFRCAKNLDLFDDSHDLISNDNYSPWTIPPYKVATSSGYASIYKQLVSDNFLSWTTHETWARIMTMASINTRPSSGPLLYYLTQPFLLRFNECKLTWYPTINQKINFCYTMSPLAYTLYRPRRLIFPYGGLGLVRLEPCGEKDRVAFRVLKIIEPVQHLIKDYTGRLLQPTEGMLIQRLEYHGNEPVAVTRDLHKGSALKDLLELPVNFDDLP